MGDLATIAASLPLSSGWNERDLRESSMSEKAIIGPQGVQAFGSSFQKRMELNSDNGEGFRDFVVLNDDLIAINSHFRPLAEQSTQFDGRDLLKFHFKLSGHNVLRFDGAREVVLKGGSAAVATHPSGLMKTDIYAGDAVETSLTLACRPQVITEILQLDPDSFPSELRSYLSGGAIDFFCRDVPLTSRMIQTINDLLTPRYAPAVRHIHAHARMLDLMCLLIDALLTSQAEPRSGLVLKQRDTEALHAARDILKTRLQSPPTVVELAREVGINRTKLAQGFKHVFGETVFDFSQRARLEAARALLTDTDQPIGDVAASAGYEHQSSFTVAFKAHFGLSPGAMRRH
jgi:AraC-like DNA-binding protein